MSSTQAVRDELLQTHRRLLTLLELTPGDRLAWKPSPNSRSILEIAAHCAHALENIVTQMEGTPFPFRSSAAADPEFRRHDQTVGSREAVEAQLAAAFSRYAVFLDSQDEAALDRIVELPFGLGSIPVRYFVGAGARHTEGHIAQIEYVQTIYGDHDWHTGF